MSGWVLRERREIWILFFCCCGNAYLIVAFTVWNGIAASDIYGAVCNSPKKGTYDTVLIFVSSDECIAYCEQHNGVHFDIVFGNT